MRTIVRLFVPLALLGACSRDAGTNRGMSDELRKDLEASTAAKPELANAGGAYQPMRFVSDLEQARQAETVQRNRTPRRVAAQTANLDQSETTSPAAAPREEIQVAQAPSPTTQSPAPESDVPRVPSVAPRPSPLPVDVPSTEGYGRGSSGIGRGDGRGVDIGDVIGVVIRGGAVGDDHCVPRRRGRGRFPILP